MSAYLSMHTIRVDTRRGAVLTLFPALDAARLQKASLLLGLLGLAGMPRSRGWGDGARLKVKDGVQTVENIVLAGELAGVVQGQIGSCSQEGTGVSIWWPCEVGEHAVPWNLP